MIWRYDMIWRQYISVKGQVCDLTACVVLIENVFQ